MRGGDYVKSITPGVAYVSENGLVRYNKLPKNYDANGHEYVDLGLPSGTLWATMNVGANSPEEYGKFFRWGETVGEEEYLGYNPETYQLIDKDDMYEDGECDSYYKFSKYPVSYCKRYSAEYYLEEAYDAANVNWGGDWKIPNIEDVNELIENTETSVVSENEEEYYRIIKLTSKINSKSIIFKCSYNILYLTSMCTEGLYTHDFNLLDEFSPIYFESGEHRLNYDVVRPVLGEWKTSILTKLKGEYFLQ